MSTKLCKKAVFLYSAKKAARGRFDVTEGEVEILKIGINENRYGTFAGVNDDGKPYRIEVSGYEGVMNQGRLWLEERDDKRAIEIFIADAERSIERYKRSIEGRRKFIEELEKLL